MGNFNVVKVDRTKIVINGEFSLEVANKLFGEVCKTRLASMKVDYDEDANTTTLQFFPCVIQNVDSVVEYAGYKGQHQERRIVLIGTIPEFVNFVDGYWKPVRSNAKRKKSDVQWVVMLIKRVSTPHGEDATELSFIVDSRCNSKNVGAALDTATQIMAEKLQLIVQDVNPGLMSSARLLDEISMDMANRIHKLEDDATAARYERLGLRKFDTDDLIFGDKPGTCSAR